MNTSMSICSGGWASVLSSQSSCPSRVKTGIRAVAKFGLWVVVVYGLMILIVMGLAQFGLVLRGYFG